MAKYDNDHIKRYFHSTLTLLMKNKLVIAAVNKLKTLVQNYQENKI